MVAGGGVDALGLPPSPRAPGNYEINDRILIPRRITGVLLQYTNVTQVSLQPTPQKKIT